MTFLERLGEELEEATARAADRAPVPGVEAASAPPAPLGPHSVLRYAVAEGAERYRRIMRVLCTEHRNFGLRLSPEAVGERLREAFELELDPLAVASHLEQLHTWGAVTREYDTGLARTARELRRNRFTYDISPAGKRTEELLEALDQLGATVGALEGSRLPAIRDALRRIARLLDAERPGGVELRREFEALTGEIERLHAGASDFMSSLNVVIVRSEQIDEVDFDRCKGVLIEHLQGFRTALRLHSDEIVEALRTVDRLGAERMVGLIVSELELPELPGLTREQLAAQRQHELHGQWLGVRSWFVDEDGRRSPWAALNFDDFQRDLGIARNVLQTRLERLVGAGILRRERYQERPERFEYRLTSKGVELWPALVSLMHWGNRHVYPEGPPIVLTHKECGGEVDDRRMCDRCGAALQPWDVQPELGSGAPPSEPAPAAS